MIVVVNDLLKKKRFEWKNVPMAIGDFLLNFTNLFLAMSIVVLFCYSGKKSESKVPKN